MPYIDQIRRVNILVDACDIGGGCDGTLIHLDEIKTVGELNYAITMLCENYLEKNGKSYKTINDIVGVLTCASNEFYRKIAVPYEEEKEQENGSIF